MLLRQGQSSSWIRVGIARAARDEHSLDPRKFLLEIRLCVACKLCVYAEIILAERRAVAGSSKKHGKQFAVWGFYSHDRDCAVYRTTRIHADNYPMLGKLATIHDERSDTAAPG